ncbi:MAG: Plug domain-containing protein, partial [Thermoanaerobaculia bacterium]
MLVKNIRLFPWLALSAILVPGIPPSALAQDSNEVVEEESEEPETTPAIEETITVIGIRAGDELPVTKTNLDREELETLSYGQDVPQLLQYTPAMTWYSDSGIGSNYSYFSMRGIQQTRINMTFDGAPLNDPAEHAVYFNNFHDFTN